MSEECTNIKIYEWPDGSYLSAFLREERGDLLTGYVPSFLPEVEIELQLRTGLIYSYNNQIGNPRVSASKEEQRKILGWILDMGFQIYSNRTHSGLVSEYSKVHIGRYPRWIPDEIWNLRYLSFSLHFEELAPPFLGVIRKLVKQFQYSVETGKCDGIIASWRTESRGSDGSVYAELDDTPESKERAVVKIVDHICKSELLLPESQRESWESAHSERGRFTQLSPEEVEVYRLLGEPLPYLLPSEELQQWLSSRS